MSAAHVGEVREEVVVVLRIAERAREDLVEVGVNASPDEQVKKLALLSADCGLDGVVCSAAETPLLREIVPLDFCLVTPGIRRPEDAAADQKRIVGPAQAISNGSTFLVVGRPINQAASPGESLATFNQEISSVL